MKKASLILFVLISFCALTCKKNPVTPQPPLDTTSHNFTWTLQRLGGASGSVLYDVAIINDTLTYAVGEMYLNDSTGQIDLHPITSRYGMEGPGIFKGYHTIIKDKCFTARFILSLHLILMIFGSKLEYIGMDISLRQSL